MITIKRLESGYYHIQGGGPCEWAQPPRWPCSHEELEESFFSEASPEFRSQVRIMLDRILDWLYG